MLNERQFNEMFFPEYGFVDDSEDVTNTDWALRDDLSYNDEREFNALDFPEDAANPDGTIIVKREEEGEESHGGPPGTANVSTPLAETTVQDPSTPDPNAELDDALLADNAAVHSRWSQLQRISANLDRVQEVIRDDEAKIKAQLEELWVDNTDVRRRGLRGGTARKNRKDHGNYVKFGETAAMSAEFHQHRLDVEKQDYEGRNRQAGLAALRDMFEQTHRWIAKQVEVCEDMVRSMAIAAHFVRVPAVDAKLSNMHAIVFGEPEENRSAKIADIEQMLAAFAEEYHLNLE
ncbi:hypothetical protein G647_04114 [Cladophialophora carrionii CBS 160.54]|uniref:Uncharacterized protein n=1 Tax=Cladophialophora carrionii CBS 160.54 TaxID=1279043 RepID=V9DCW4_9EURO|nr:uncharacterized protein G647_04114 [Cladophialophora carrionii CBS 160.54]ETI24744.1 hypothetical protein G647_04114 [Cladophialophora carrionii CBS 160.54]